MARARPGFLEQRDRQPISRFDLLRISKFVDVLNYFAVSVLVDYAPVAGKTLGLGSRHAYRVFC